MSARPILFVGQAPPRVVVPVSFGRTRLYKWFELVGVAQEELLAHSASTALVSHFPGKAGFGDRPPAPAEIAAERGRVRELIRTLQPRVIVPVGVLSIRELLGDPMAQLAEVVGNRYEVQLLQGLPSFTIIPLPHPSGASPWVHMDDHMTLVLRALAVIRDELCRA